jgi:itaconate CoA-transferase
MKKPLEDIVVVSLEQAVAAPFCTSHLADAGARVIKIERPEGDFARGYDRAVHGESSYFVWVNRGKESVVLDLRQDEAKATLTQLMAAADVFVQNLAPGAASRLGFDSTTLRARHPQLITCDISGYGDAGPLKDHKAYDLLVQAESGLISVSGAPGPWGRIGVSICDIAAGMNALIGIQQALLQRARTGNGSGVKVSLLDSAAELMSVPYLQTRYGAGPPERVGLKHPSIAPYGAFTCSDGQEIVLSIQNEREWVNFCATVLLGPELAKDPRFDSNTQRTTHRDALEAHIQSIFARLSHQEAARRLSEAQTAYGTINSVHALIRHPQLRTRNMMVGNCATEIPALPYVTEWDEPSFAPAPRLNEHNPLPTPGERPFIHTPPGRPSTPDGIRHTFVVDGLRLAALEWGRRDGQPIVMLHGLRDSARTFRTLAKSLQASHRVIAIDLRGRGDSDWDPACNYHTDTYVADLLAIVDALKLPSFDLLGHSMGGGVAIVFASTHPSRVRRLVIEDAGPGVFDTSPGSARIRQEMGSMPARFDTLDEAFQALCRMRPGLARDKLDERLPFMVKPSADGGFTWCHDHVGIARARLSSDPARTVDLRPHVRRLQSPTLLLRGGDSIFLLPEMAQAMVAANARIVLEEIAGAGHYVHEEAPEPFCRRVASFLLAPDRDGPPGSEHITETTSSDDKPPCVHAT